MTLETAVALVVFNRESATRASMTAIRAARPKRLYVIADGPRPGVAGEPDACARTRAAALEVDWNCDVHTNFSDVNLGVLHRPPSGFDWVFKQEERAIIIEDDCVAEPTFFRYCEELLARYEHDPSVMAVSGFCPLPMVDAPPSYRFQQLSVVWGWASWRRAWSCYHADLASLEAAFRAHPGRLARAISTPKDAARRARLQRRRPSAEVETGSGATFDGPRHLRRSTKNR